MKNSDKNPIILNTIKLLRAIRNADTPTLQEAKDELAVFGNSWLIEGSMKPLSGMNDSCLADTDITEGIREILETRIDENENQKTN